jgi:uncharacterized membrane protein YfcA
MTLAAIYFAYVIVGIVAGILGGLLGIGGGIVTVPCLLFLFHCLGFPPAYIMHLAVATSLAAMIFNTAASTIAHHQRKSVVWDVFRKLAPGLVIGAVIGSFVALWLSTYILEIFFGVFLLVIAVRFYTQQSIREESHKLPHPLILNLLSCLIGAISNLLGIGGGSMTVPMLTAFKMKDRNAIGTSAATTLVTTVCGTLSYWFLGRGDIDAPGTLGLINIPAFLIIGITAFFAAPYGVKLTHEIDPNKTRKIFATVLALTGLSFFI